MDRRILYASCILVMSLAACSKIEPQSTTDPLPLPSEIEANKDLSVKPGDSFFDYCNGTWLRQTPIPASGNVGGLYDVEKTMEEYVRQLKALVPDIGHFYELMDHMHNQPEKSRAYLDAQKARFPKPSTKEEAFLTMGKMIADGVEPTSITPFVSTFSLTLVDGKLMGLISPPIHISNIPLPTPAENLVPASQTKADSQSAFALVVQGMGLDMSQVAANDDFLKSWDRVEAMSLDELCQILDEAWDSYEMFVSEEQMNKIKATQKDALSVARSSLSYTLSYHLADQFISPSLKERLVTITKEVQASLRKRLEKVEWMSETTRNNALEKLDNYGLFVAYPDQWHRDCVSSLGACETLAEAVHINKRNIARMKTHLIGGKDLFSSRLVSNMLNSDYDIIPADLTLCNAMYDANSNSVFIYPALMMPPFLPEGVSDAYAYAAFVIIGHEFTHGFDTVGSQYDKDGNKNDWWTVADKMAFEERRENIIQCYNHLQMDPQRAPDVYGDGARTQMENIADLGGFLAVLDAYKALLEKEGYFGKLYDDQLRKFYECFAHSWCVQYGEEKLSVLQKSDVHSHARLRVNGVVMNTDLWYELYDVDRNHYLYLPEERRTYIW